MALLLTDLHMFATHHLVNAWMFLATSSQEDDLSNSSVG